MEVKGEFKNIRFGVDSSDTIESVKLKIEKETGIHVQFQTLKPQSSDEEFEDDKTLEDYNIYKDATIRLEINRSREKEIGLAVGGKMKQKIYEDDKDNIDFYNIKRVTRLFVNICNGTMWQAITGKKLPPSPLTPQTNRLFITTHSFDSVYFGIIFDIDVYKRKQSKTATTSINK